MGFLFGSKKKEKIVAIFDIGSGSVGGAFARIPTDGKGVPFIMKSKSVRNDIKYHENFNFDLFLKDMIDALSQSANSLYNKKIGAPDEIVCVLASPWYLSETRTVKMSKDEPFTFSKSIASELIQKEISGLTESYKTKYGNLNSIP